jgi:hypothetical protein
MVMTAECLACQHGVSIEEYCAHDPGMPGCFAWTSGSAEGYGGYGENSYDGYGHEDSCRVLVAPSVYHFGLEEGTPTMPGITMYKVNTCEKFCLHAGAFSCKAAFRSDHDACGSGEEVPCNAPFDVDYTAPEPGYREHMCECGENVAPQMEKCLENYDEKYYGEGKICPAGTIVDGPSLRGMMLRTIADMQPTQIQTLACPEGFLGSVTVMCGAGGTLCPMWNDCQPVPSEMCHSIGGACFAAKLGGST